MGDSASAILKLTTLDPFGPPGCMLGYQRWDTGWKRDPDLQAALDEALEMGTALLETFDAAEFPGIPRTMAPFSFAVADLTDDPGRGFGLDHPAYAGHADARTTTVASISKLLALYGAYQLRSDLRALAAGRPSATLAELAEILREHHRHMGASLGAYPLVEDLFAVDAGRIDFTQGIDVTVAATPAGPEERLQVSGGVVPDFLLTRIDIDDHVNLAAWSRPKAAAGRLGEGAAPADKRSAIQAQLRSVGFREQLRLMCGWSNNLSASIAIQSLGFPYLWKLATRSRLYRRDGWEQGGKRRQGPGGLFLGRDFVKNNWTRRPPEAPLIEAQASQAGSAQALATMFAALIQERLVDHEAHVEMLQMLRMQNQDFTPGPTPPPPPVPPAWWSQNILRRGEECPIGLGLAAAGWRAAQEAWRYGPLPDPLDPSYPRLTGPLAASKIGLLDLRNETEPAKRVCVASNVLLVRSDRPSGAGTAPITAVLVGMVNTLSVDPAVLVAVLRVFGKVMAAALEDRHP